MGKKIYLTSEIGSVEKGIEFIRKALEEKKIPSKKITKTLLTAEEVLAKLVANATDKESQISVEVGGLLGNVEINFKGKGEPFSAIDIEKQYLFEQSGEDANIALRNLMDRVLGDHLEIKNSGGYNVISIKAKKSNYSGLVCTLIALFLGIFAGYLMKIYLPGELAKAISTNLFVPIYTIFMNALKMIVAPLVFCSIAASIAKFGDLKALGRIAVRIIAAYLCTSVIAICVGFFTYQMMPIGDPSMAAAVSEEAAASTLAKGEGVVISIKDTLVGIVPSDIITPFQKSDMLQIIFMAVLVGITVSAISRKYPLAQEALSILDALTAKITTGLVTYIPLIVFVSMAKMMISMNLGSLVNVALWVPVIYIGDLIMIVIYLLILGIFGGLNPLMFLSKYYPAMFSAFTLASSNAALPSSIRQCNALGVSQKVYSFSLPMGATINMDGSCISLMISSLFFAKIFNIPVTTGVILSLFIATMVLSVGSPGVPGGNLVCIALLAPQIGVPAEAISLIMGLYPIVGMMQTCANVTGDAVVTTIVAKHEKLLDVAKFNS
ncbi:Na+/H+-dicarboxylate symporter [Lachnospiraceae bacterium]|nr:Na+/H+-dicarboxylate symporter [Lachnospiraceae bacterium]